MKLTDRQTHLLNELEAVHRIPGHGRVDGGWSRPMDVGGTDASYHSAVLVQLVRKGLAERRRYGHGSWLYRISEAGLRLHAERRAARVAA